MEIERQAIQMEMASFLKKDHGIRKKLQQLEGLKPQNRIVSKQITQLADRIHAGSQLAHTITQQVRLIDETQQKVSNSFSRVQQLLQLRKCVVSMRSALQFRKYDDAIDCVRVFQRIKSGKNHENADQMEMERLTKEFRDKIQRLALEEVTKTQQLTSIASYLEPLELDAEVLQVFLQHSSQSLQEQLHHILSLHKSSAEELSLIINLSAKTVQENKKMLRDHFQLSRGFERFVLGLHQVTQGFILRVLKKVTIREEEKLDDMAILIQYVETYNRFLQQHECEQAVVIDNLVDQFVALEKKFLHESTQKAKQFEQYQVSSCTSSFIEELFYLCQNVAERATATGHARCIESTFKLVCQTLSSSIQSRPNGEEVNQVCVILPNEKSQRNLFAKRTTKEVITPEAIEEWKTTVMTLSSPLVCVNNLERSIDYIQQMPFKDTFLPYQNTLTHFKGQHQKVIHLIVHQLFQPKLQSILLNLRANMTYDLTEAAFEQVQTNDPFIQPFLRQLDHLLLGVEQTLTESNIEAVKCELARVITDLILQSMRDKVVNQLGGIQFDHEVRVLIAHWNNTVAIRSGFDRLLQVSAILNVDSIQDCVELYGFPIKGISWVLSPDETKIWLTKRIEFQKDLDQIRTLLL